MDSILVYLDTNGGDVKKASLEVLSTCRSVADRLGFSVAAVIVQPPGRDLPESIAHYGPDEVIVVTDPKLEQPTGQVLVAAMAAAIERTQPALTVFASSERAKDFLGALAVRVGGRILSDVISFDFDGARLTAMRPVMSGNKLARVETIGERLLVSVLPGNHALVASPSKPEVITLGLDRMGDIAARMLDAAVEQVRGGKSLTEANVVVAAGRGVKDEAGRMLIEDLAAVFDGAVGSSRAVVESGLFPATTQIGQTGKVVSPELYFAIGISGAIQHVAGMTGSRVVVAINKDAEAPIFDHATFGLVGDLYEILPPLIEELKRRKMTV